MPVTLPDARPFLLPRLALLLLLLACSTALGAQDWTYRVRPGDTLWDLGTRYLKPTISWQELQSHNIVADPYRRPTG